MASRCGSLLLLFSADVRFAADDVIAFEGTGTRRGCRTATPKALGQNSTI